MIIPNPNTGNFAIEGLSIGSYKLIDITGKVVYQFIQNVEGRQVSIQLNQPAGMYFIRNAESGAMKKEKIIILR